MGVDQPLVTVLISNYNYEHFLTETIDSALNQTYPNTEVIVVDDGSTDNSREVIASYKDRIIPIYKENGGQGSAFNAGFSVSQSKIVCFLDSDDIWLPQKVEKVVEAFNTYPDAAVVYHKIQNIDSEGKQFGQPWPGYKPIKGSIFNQVAKTGGWWPFPPSSALSYQRDFLYKVMNVPEKDYRICADTYLADLAPFCGEVVGIDQVLSYYRLHNSNSWGNLNSGQDNARELRVLQDHEFRVNRLNCKLEHLGIDVKVSLAEHWPYQLSKYKLSHKKDLIYLSLLALQNPWEHRFISKLKTVAQLWLQRGSFSRI